MSKAKQKYYVVWQGREPGIYLTWEECKAQVHGAEGARYKSFPTMEEAQRALGEGAPPIDYKRKAAALSGDGGNREGVCPDAYAVDAACSGNPGMMEYRGVEVESGRQLFHYGPIMGTNNIGEFLAIVHALAMQKQMGTVHPIYSDSRNALLWIKARKCRTKLPLNDKTAKAHELIARAERWLSNNDYSEFKILKWHTDRWGEIPADFGRK